MSVKTRSDPERAGAATEVEAAANLARELITADQVLQWTLEGKCFTASVPIETDSIDGQTDHFDTLHDFVLASDLAGTKLIIPIATTIGITTTGGSGGVDLVLEMNKPTNDTATRKVFSSGTSMTILNNRSDGYGTQVATAEYTVTCSALTDTEMVEIAAFHTRSNSASSTYVSINNHTVIVNHLKQGAPIILYKGAALSSHAWSATAPTYRVTFQWAELDAATYLPKGG